MNRPLAGLRVWITRPQPAADRSVDVWREAGADATAVPTLRLVPIRAEESLRRTLREELSPAWKIVLTSANAASFLIEALADEPEIVRTLQECPAYAVGEATAVRARELGLQVVHVARRAVGTELAASMIERGEGQGPILLPGSDVRRRDVEQAFRNVGADVLACTVYANEPADGLAEAARAALAAGHVDIVAFYSPSAVRGFLAAAAAIVDDPATCCPVAVLGPTTRDEAKAAGCRIVAEPASPGETALLEATARWWAERSHE